MGNIFISGFNPISDENGHNLDERFHSKIKTISNKTNDVYCVLISDDNTCHKYKINDTADPELMKTYTASKLFKYIFGEVLKRYIEHPKYKNMSEEELEQICSDFAQHLKNASKVILNNDADVETDRFSIKFPNNAFAKYSDPTKVLDNIVDDFGHKVLFYEQKDIGEFFLNFLERMQEGLGENKVLSRKMMENQNFINKYNL